MNDQTSTFVLPRRKCLRCGYIWVPRKVEPPRACPGCHHRGWQQPRGWKKRRTKGK